ncbi:AAA family ATPase [Xanthomonas citri pv. citri]|uniref:AAA family ATPase n=1 Tax=Xanthomonas citri TaxID=346 RepID=UPI0036DE5899
MSNMIPARLLHLLDIQHVRYLEIYRKLYTQLSMGAPGSVVMLVGPTRVGKSRLVCAVARALVGETESDATQPVIVIEAATTHGGRFSMKHFTMRALQELRHPLFGEHGHLIRRSESETQLRLQLEQAIVHRQTRYLIIDEAHHLLRTPQIQRAAEVLDSLKCLANSTGVILVLAGAYELFTAGLASTHLNGRMRVIEFGRYQPGGQDNVHYLGILKGLDVHLPWKNGHSLLGHSQYVQAGTLGCLGLLLAWVNAAMCEMISRGEELLCLDHFVETRFEEQIALIAREIEAGESAMSRLRPFATKTQATFGSVDSGGTPRSRKPFQRIPKRDPVDAGRR